jgi:hypothetical protein
MIASFANGLAMAHLVVFRSFHAGRSNGFVWLLIGFVIIVLFAWTFSWVSKRPSSKD